MRKVLYLVVLSIFFVNCTNQKNDSEYHLIHKRISDQLKSSPVLDKGFTIEGKRRIFPRTSSSSGKLILVNKRDWTSGFYPGVLWYMYKLTGDNYWKTNAEKFTVQLDSEKFNDNNHDLGFKMMSSYGLGVEFSNNEQYKEVLIQSARTLISRFNENVGSIKSWNHNTDKWEFPVIIDNLMNLELLFWAWKETGDNVFYNVAVTHANTTIKNHFRKDFSSFHVVGYDSITGNVISKNTHQGYADSSSWARGQAWALYGFTMIYRETKNTIYLEQAKKVADYILNVETLSDDFIPTWDFDLKEVESEPQDASAAAVIASALYELSSFVKEESKEYRKQADSILRSLSSEKYFNNIEENNGFLLKHSTGSKPSNSEVDVPLVYADYYYLEAILRKKQIKNN